MEESNFDIVPTFSGKCEYAGNVPPSVVEEPHPYFVRADQLHALDDTVNLFNDVDCQFAATPSVFPILAIRKSSTVPSLKNIIPMRRMKSQITGIMLWSIMSLT